MHLYFRYGNGTRVEAILLAVSRNMIRAVVPGDLDATELRLKTNTWLDEAGREIALDAVTLASGTPYSDFGSRLQHAA